MGVYGERGCGERKDLTKSYRLICIEGVSPSSNSLKNLQERSKCWATQGAGGARGEEKTWGGTAKGDEVA